MRITIETELLKASELTFDEYLWLYAKATGNSFGVKVRIVLSDLERRGYLKVTSDGSVLREKSYRLFDIDDAKISDWIEEWRSMFPKGVRSGSYPVRGDARSCKSNMERFMKHYPQYTRKLIMDATKVYIDRLRVEQWKYMTCAHYFIIKDGFSTGVSKLAAECEAYLEKGETTEDGNGRITTQL